MVDEVDAGRCQGGRLADRLDEQDERPATHQDGHAPWTCRPCRACRPTSGRARGTGRSRPPRRVPPAPPPAIRGCEPGSASSAVPRMASTNAPSAVGVSRSPEDGHREECREHRVERGHEPRHGRPRELHRDAHAHDEREATHERHDREPAERRRPRDPGRWSREHSRERQPHEHQEGDRGVRPGRGQRRVHPERHRRGREGGPERDGSEGRGGDADALRPSVGLAAHA